MKKFAFVALAVAAIALATPAEAAKKSNAAEISELKALVQKLAARVEELEGQTETTTKTAISAEQSAKATAAQLNKIEPAAGEHLYRSSRNGFNWNGPYVGAFVATNTTASETGIGATTGNQSLDGFSGGLHLGYNYVMKRSNVLIGAELEAALADQQTDFTTFPLTHEMKIKSTVAIRGRLGKIYGDNLVFVQAGYGLANMTDRIFPAGPDLLNGWMKGVQGGVGYERAINDVFTWRVDYLYTNYFKEQSNIIAGWSADIDTHSLRFGVGMKF